MLAEFVLRNALAGRSHAAQSVGRHLLAKAAKLELMRPVVARPLVPDAVGFAEQGTFEAACPRV